MFKAFGHWVDWDDPAPANERVAKHDIVRRDYLGRDYVVVPAGTAPEQRVKLTPEEAATLVYAPPPKPKGHMTAVGYGFTPEQVVRGEYPND